MKPRNNFDDYEKILFSSGISSIPLTEASASSEDVEMTAITETEVKIKIDSFKSGTESDEIIRTSPSFSSIGSSRNFSDTMSSADDFYENVLLESTRDSHQSSTSLKCVSAAGEIKQDFKRSSEALGKGSTEKCCQSPKKPMLKTSQDDDVHTSTESSQSILGEASAPVGTTKQANGDPKITATILYEGGNLEEGNLKVTETEQLIFPHVSQYNESQAEEEIASIMNLWKRISIIKTQLKKMGIIFPCTEQPDGESNTNAIASTSGRSTSVNFSMSEKLETDEMSSCYASFHPGILRSRKELSCEEHTNSYETAEGSSTILLSSESRQRIRTQGETKETDTQLTKSKSSAKIEETGAVANAHVAHGPAESKETKSYKRFLNNSEPAADSSTLNVFSEMQQEKNCKPEIENVLQSSESISLFDTPSSEVLQERRINAHKGVIKIKKDIIVIMRDISKGIPNFRLVINRLSPALSTRRTDYLLNTARDIVKVSTILNGQCHRLLSRIQANQVERILQSVDFSILRSYKILEKDRAILNDTFWMMNEYLQLLRQCKVFVCSYKRTVKPSERPYFQENNG